MPEKSRARLGNRKFIVSLQVMLARLGYFKRPFDGEIDERLVAGIDAYRKDRDFPTGQSVFDQAVADRLYYDTTALDLTTSIGLPEFVIDDRELAEGLLRVTGTWTGFGGPIENPENASEISCRAVPGICIEALAELQGDRDQLVSTLTITEVTVWNDEKIEFNANDTCQRVTTTIDLERKKVIRSRNTTGADDCEEVGGMSFVFELVDGSKAEAGLVMGRWIERNRVLGLTGGP